MEFVENMVRVKEVFFRAGEGSVFFFFFSGFWEES